MDEINETPAATSAEPAMNDGSLAKSSQVKENVNEELLCAVERGVCKTRNTSGTPRNTPEHPRNTPEQPRGSIRPGTPLNTKNRG